MTSAENGGATAQLRSRGKKTGLSEHQAKIMEYREKGSEKLEENRQITRIKADLQTRTLQATLRLARWSLQCAKTEKAPGFFEPITRPMSKMLFREPDLRDFMMAFNLIHDWYPKLQKEASGNCETWDGCTKEVLNSMLELLNEKLIYDDYDGSFRKWVTGIVEKHHDNAKHEQLESARKVLASMQNLLDEKVYGSGDSHKLDALYALLKDMKVKSELERRDVANPSQIHEAELKEAEVLCVQCSSCASFDEHAKFDEVRQNLQAMHALLCGIPEDSSLIPIKTRLLRVIWIISMLEFFFLYESSALGMSIQIGLEMGVGKDKEQPTFFIAVNYVFFIALPVLVLLYSITGSMLADLVSSSVQDPPFNIARARLIVVLTPLLSNRNILQGDDLARCPIRVIDIFLTDGLLIFMLFGFFVQIPEEDDTLMDSSLKGLNIGALCWTACYFTLSTAADLYLNLWLEFNIEKAGQQPGELANALDEVIFRPTRCVFILGDAFQKYGIFPGDTWTHFLALQRHLEIHKLGDIQWNAQQVPDWVKNENLNPDSWKAYSNKLGACDSFLEVSSSHRGHLFLCVSVVVWVLTGIICFCVDYFTGYQHKGWVLLSANVGMILTVVYSSFAAEHFLPHLTSGSFRFHSILFLLLICFLSYMTIAMSVRTDLSLTPVMKKSSTNETGIFYNDGSNQYSATPYPACSMEWGSPQARVRILDLAAMAYYAYVGEEKNFIDLLSESFKRDTEVVFFDEFNTLPRIVAARICEKGNSQRPSRGLPTEPCTVIMAVKGTSTTLEILTDLGIFSTIGVMQMLNIVAPLRDTVPITVISYMIDWFRLPSMKHTQMKLFEKIETVYWTLIEKYPKDSVVITGHSIGGHLAELAGARLDIPAVGFSAPGQLYMMKSLKISRQEIDQTVMTVIPQRDVAPHVAPHVDTVQRILCRRKNGRFRKPHECNSIEAGACEIWRVCGDIEMRSFAEKCLEKRKHQREPFVGKNCIGQSFKEDKNASCKVEAPLF